MRLAKSRSARGWVKGEPCDDRFPFEEPRLLHRAIKMLVEQGIVDKSELAFQLGLSEYLLESLSDLSEGYFSKKVANGNLVELKPRFKNATEAKNKNTEFGNVVNFLDNKKS